MDSSNRGDFTRRSELTGHQELARAETIRPERAADRRQHPRVASLLPALALVAGGLFASCRCTDAARAYSHTHADTPRGALDRFVLFWKAGLHDLEYVCFSSAFRQRHRLSLQAYDVGRSELERELPWLARFAQAEVIGEEQVGRSEHVFWVAVAGRTVRVNLLREETARIWAGDELLADGDLDLARALSVERDGTLHLKLTPDATYRPFEAAEVTGVRAESSWRIDDFAEVPRDSVPRPKTP